MQATEWLKATKGLTQAQKAQLLGFSLKKVKALDRAARAGEAIDSIPDGKVRAALVRNRPECMTLSGGRIIAVRTGSSRLPELISKQSQPMSLNDRMDFAVQLSDAWRNEPKSLDFASWRTEAITRAKTR